MTLLAPHDDVPDAVALWAEAGADRVEVAMPFGHPRQSIEAAVVAAAGTVEG